MLHHTRYSWIRKETDQLPVYLQDPYFLRKRNLMPLFSSFHMPKLV
jgi:hypothetical protein